MNKQTSEFEDDVLINDLEQPSIESWTVTASEAGERMDKWLAGQFGGGVSRTQIQEWIQKGQLLVNGRLVKTNYKLVQGDEIVVERPQPESYELIPEPMAIDVTYEDADVIVVNKPRGLVVHPAPGHSSGTLVHGLLHHCTDLSGINGVLRPGIVHRIDKDTSGLIMVAKNDLAHASLAAQLKAHTVHRSYVALVIGNVAHDVGTIDAPIGRDPNDRKLYTVIATNSKQAVTHFCVLERFGDVTLVELKLETGRTHQIRVHMKYIGHPLVGDPAYGSVKSKGILPIEGQALHAASLGFVHPRTGETLRFQAELPDDMERLLKGLRNR